MSTSLFLCTSERPEHEGFTLDSSLYAKQCLFDRERTTCHGLWVPPAAPFGRRGRRAAGLCRGDDKAGAVDGGGGAGRAGPGRTARWCLGKQTANNGQS